MKIRLFFLTIALALFPCPRSAIAQVTAKTADMIQEVSPDGSMNLTFQYSFDAGDWKRWLALVGNDPARMRAMMRHDFAALVIDEFKLEKDDMNRTAKMTMRSPAGPELRKDKRFQIPVDGWCRMINHVGREWFFSGINPATGNTQNTWKIVLPANTVEATLVNAGTSDQALVYSLSQPAGKASLFVWSGAVVMVSGGVLLAVGLLAKKSPTITPAAA